MAGQEAGGSVASASVKARLGFLAGGAAVAAAAAYRLIRRRTPEAPPEDRAAALRQKLAESREVVEEREEYEAAETPVDTVADVDEARRAVHERGREAAEHMRGDGS
jgi:acetyl-CoA carboxylase carboxyltransferase component